MDRRAVALGLLGSGIVLGYLLARGPAWESIAVVLAAILPAGLVLYGGAARGRAGALRVAQELTEQAFRRSERTNLDLQERLAELMTLNELAAAAGSTLDRDELLDRSLAAMTRHLRFDRALVLLADEGRGVLGAGRSIGGSAEMSAGIAELELPLNARVSQLVQFYHSDGPLLFRDADRDSDERNRAFAEMRRSVPSWAPPSSPRGDPSGSWRSTTGSPGATFGRATGPAPLVSD